jgi:hypothetical protein
MNARCNRSFIGFLMNSKPLIINRMTQFQKIAAWIAFSMPLVANAQGYQVNLQGQAQQAMASAGTAYMQDGAALFFNPGGVSFL